MSLPKRTTICAIATASGGAERGVVRVSGPLTRSLSARCFAVEGCAPELRQRELLVGRFSDLRGHQPALLLWMPGPHSFTGEDVAEFHLPGSPPLLDAALERLIAEGCELARPGEFTRRAFESGRIDLSRAEGVHALVEAENEAEARAAAALLAGGLEHRVSVLREGLLDVRALCEASLDFEHEDTGAVEGAEIEELLAPLGRSLAELRAGEGARRRSNAGVRVVLAGRTNAGKSELFNALTGSEVLVSSTKSTTRDSLHAAWVAPAATPIDAAGVAALELVDVAGLDVAALAEPDLLARAHAAREQRSAEVLLWVVDARRTSLFELQRELTELQAVVPIVLAWNQVDREDAEREPPEALAAGVTQAVPISALESLGLKVLRDAVAAAHAGRTGARGEGFSTLALSRRHHAALGRCADELSASRGVIEAGSGLELAAEHLRHATSALDEISGESSPEDVLDRIFGRFCLGK